MSILFTISTIWYKINYQHFEIWFDFYIHNNCFLQEYKKGKITYILVHFVHVKMQKKWKKMAFVKHDFTKLMHLLFYKTLAE